MLALIFSPKIVRSSPYFEGVRIVRDSLDTSQIAIIEIRRERHIVKVKHIMGWNA